MTTPDGRGLPQPPTDRPAFGQSAVGNTGTTVQVGGSDVGNINISRLPKLPITPIPRGDQEAALEPVRAHTPTPQRAANLLAAHGLAVILGERGTGRRISAVRALHTHLSTPQARRSFSTVQPTGMRMKHRNGKSYPSRSPDAG